ncbi:hypothetical protein JCM33374_g3806 [Metschnikowia sp. JCM 33374]|nr:hypothetical protein JCM33374_g3806 [Metschnikowia sp. JCM 33374]
MKTNPIILFATLAFSLVSAAPSTNISKRFYDEERGTDLENQIQTLVVGLKALVNETAFNVLVFDAQEESFAEEFSMLNTFFSLVGPFPKPAHQKYEFASDVFYSMKVARDFWVNTHTTGSNADQLLYSIYELSLSVLILVNDQGVPNPDIPRYADIVGGFKARLKLMRNEVAYLTHVPMSQMLMLRSVLIQANTSIQFLTSKLRT